MENPYQKQPYVRKVNTWEERPDGWHPSTSLEIAEGPLYRDLHGALRRGYVPAERSLMPCVDGVYRPRVTARR